MSSNPARTFSSTLAPAAPSIGHRDLSPVLPPIISAPRARVEPRITTMHGDTWVDNYFWLRDRNDPEVIAYLEAENSYTSAMMRHTEALQEQLYQEMRGRIKETDLSVPERMDDYLYYSRTESGRQYPI